MTTDEAISWCQQHTAIVLFHEGRIVVVVPHSRVDVTAYRARGMEIKVTDGGFTCSMSDPGDELKDVVAAAKSSYDSRSAGRIHRLGRESGSQVDFSFVTDM